VGFSKTLCISEPGQCWVLSLVTVPFNLRLLEVQLCGRWVWEGPGSGASERCMI
jgi:hypothetical protein